MSIPDKNRRISPTLDLAFKKVFANNENTSILKGLIHDFFGISPNKITIENPYSINDYQEISEGNAINVLRETKRDITATLEMGDFITEMQLRSTLFFDERSLYYVFDRY